MTQRQLDREVASATGESVATIRRLGFSLVEPMDHIFEDCRAEPQILDWDEEAARPLRLVA